LAILKLKPTLKHKTMPSKKPATKKAPAKKPAAKVSLKPSKAPSKALAKAIVNKAPANGPVLTSSPAKYVKPAPVKQIEIPEGSGVFYNPTADEQEMYNLPARAQGFIEHGLANGQFQLRLNNLQGNPFSIPAFYSVEVKPKTFQLS